MTSYVHGSWLALRGACLAFFHIIIVPTSPLLLGRAQREPPQYVPSPPYLGVEAPRAAEPTAPDRKVAVVSHCEYVPTVTAAAA